jgi:hypothetical protein
MPERPVWGYSNDDMHSLSRLGRNWSLMILPELTHESVRHGMESGLSFFVYAPDGHQGPPVPVIETIEVNSRKGTIVIVASGYETIRWISEGEVVSNESTIDLDNLENPGGYLRAELSGPGSTIINTQPFGVKKIK